MSGVGLGCVPPCTGVICGIADIMRSDADGGATRRRRRFITCGPHYMGTFTDDGADLWRHATILFMY
jgi:hypothetical protein